MPKYPNICSCPLYFSAYPTADAYFDNSVLAIVTAYNDRGLADTITSYNNATARAGIVNQIAYAYNGWGGVTQSWQERDQAVDNDGQNYESPSVQYAYDDLARLISVTDPTASRVVGYSYGPAGSIDDRLSRVAKITNGTSTNAPVLAAYGYLGAGQIVKTSHPAVASGLDLTIGAKDNGTSGLDRFGRVADQLWADNSFNPVDEYKYDYDLVGNRAWKENVVAHNASKSLDEKYAYDEVYRLLGTDRGTLDLTGSPHIDSQAFSQDWSLDGLGNFSEFNDNGTTQTRAVNAANEIGTLDGGQGMPLYDAAGNLKTDGPRNYKYDAWNRQTAVSKADSTPLATYEYDGLNRRIEKTTTAAAGDPRHTNYFFNESWQVLEERTTTTNPDASQTNSIDQYVWDQSYIDTPVVRFHDANTAPASDTAGDSVLYYTTDANHNITGLVGQVLNEQTQTLEWKVVERYSYDAYGKVKIYDKDFNERAASSYSNEILYCGYRQDPETALTSGGVLIPANYLARRRILDTLLSNWTVRDFMGYSAGDANLLRYCESRPTAATDPTGLWKRLKGTLYFPEQYPKPKNANMPQREDTFESLAKEVLKKLNKKSDTHDPARYKGAIFPDPDTTSKTPVVKKMGLSLAQVKVEMKNAWARQQPWVCGVYDVKGLIAQAEHQLKDGTAVHLVLGQSPKPGQKPNNFNQYAKEFFELKWAATTDVIRNELMTASNHGKTPIKDFWLAGHSAGFYIQSDPSDTTIEKFTLGSLTGDKGREAGAEDLGSTPNDGDYWWQSFDDAEKEYFPPGFWFSTDATIVFIGCGSHNIAWAFAKSLLRENARAVGANDILILTPTSDKNDAFTASFRKTENNSYSTYEAFMRSPGWLQFDPKGNDTKWTLP